MHTLYTYLYVYMYTCTHAHTQTHIAVDYIPIVDFGAALSLKDKQLIARL